MPFRPSILPCLLLLTTLAAASGAAQGIAPASITAQRVTAPPVLDGEDNDPSWRGVPSTDAFREVRPREDGAPLQRTAFRVGYDAQYLYVFVRLYDARPDSIVGRLSRRDDESVSDHVTVMIDSYHDKRTGFEFQVNPVGVKADYAIYNDGEEDSAWDAVWDVATKVDSLGWTAEYRIPFSQLRFAPKDEVTFGFMVFRNLQRFTAQVSWPIYRQSKTGFVSQFGELRGLVGLASPRRAEVVPYVVAQSEPAPGTFNRSQKISAGGDLRLALASNILLNATVNPDFGQVEADPEMELKWAILQALID